MENVPLPDQLVAAVRRWRESGSREQEPARWSRQTWKRWLPAHSALFDSLPDAIGRDTATEAAMDVSTPADAERAFVVAMIWGHGSVGYGAYRARRVLEVNAHAQQRLFDVARAARDAGPIAGFEVLAAAPLKYLGVAFGTKYLYFCSRASSDRHAGRTAPVLDSVVSRWLSRQAGIDLPVAGWDREVYQRYLALLETWGNRLDLPMDVVEERIFDTEWPASDIAVPAESAQFEALDQLRIVLADVGSAEQGEHHVQALEQILGAAPSS